MENDVTPYKYTWTPSGLELLANIQKEMIRWDIPNMDINMISNTCNKPACAYCYEMNRLTNPSPPLLSEVISRVNAWQKWEDEYLTKNFKRLSYASMHVRLHRGPAALAQRARLLHLGIKPIIRHSA